MVRPDGFSGSKIVFKLLTKVVTFYIELTTIDIREPGLELIFLVFEPERIVK